MALVKSQTWTSISGSVGGVTWARSAQGYYMRARTVPVNPTTEFQQQVRTGFTNLVNRWTTILTENQRESWRLYAQNVPVIGPLGDAVNISGQNWYIAANTPSQQAVAKLGATINIADQASAVFNRGSFDGSFMGANTSYDVATGIDIALPTGDAWANETGAWLFLYMGRPRSPSRNFFAGPYRLVGIIEGVDPPGPPPGQLIVTPAQLAARGWPVVAGERSSFAAAVFRADGRLSTRQVFFTGEPIP